MRVERDDETGLCVVYSDYTGEVLHRPGEEAPATPAEPDGPEPPPRSGRGSGEARWREYAAGKGLSVPEGVGRDEIVALAETAGLPIGAPGEGDDDEGDG